MENLTISIVVATLSGLIFSFLLHIINQNICGIFVSIQRDLDKLSNRSIRILNFLGYILAIVISVLLRVIFNLSGVKWGIILGFLMALVDNCLGINIIDKNCKESSN